MACARRRAPWLAALALGACGGRGAAPPGAAPPGMAWIPGGEALLGGSGAEALPDEQPLHRVRLDGFWMDRTEVTNAEFRRFVAATGYVTTAERPPGIGDFPAGSLVFRPPAPGRPSQPHEWWTWVPGADWRHPEGPNSSIAGKDDHPVVQVSWEDARAYAQWAGKRLPSEAEWEYAARGGAGRPPAGEKAANIWQGDFPYANALRDGYAGTAPAASFPPNGYGLYDLAGNVWEWCADWYHAGAYRLLPELAVNPRGPERSFDPEEPETPKRVTRGGSFLCSDDYCAGYRPSARMKTSPDTSLMHTGFRCVKDGPPPR